MGGRRHALIGGRFLGVGIPGPTLDPATREHLSALKPGSVILFARNIVDVAQTRALIEDLRTLLGDVIVCVDQEGGVVVRFARELTVFPGNMALGAIGDPDLAQAQGRVAAGELRGVGFDLNLAPVCDVATDPENPGLGLRAYAADPELAARLAAATVSGARQGGIATCAKHYPGLGAARVDPHLGMPVVERDAATLEAVHGAPFRAAIAARVEAVMTAHAVYPALAPDEPAPFSHSIITGGLRERLGFDGVIISDDLEMGALADEPVGEAAVRAMLAGHDLLLVCHTPAAQLAAAEAVGQAVIDGRIPAEMAREAAARIAALSAQGDAARVAAWPVRTEGPTLARDIAERALALVPGAPFVPWASGPCHVVVPRFAELTQVEGACADVGGAVADLTTALTAAGSTPEVHVVPLHPVPGDLEAAAAAVRGDAPVLCCTFDADRHPGQRGLLAAVGAAAAGRLVVAHLRNPFDTRFVPVGVPQLQPWGFRPLQLAALAGALRGTITPRPLAAPTP